MVEVSLLQLGVEVFDVVLQFSDLLSGVAGLLLNQGSDFSLDFSGNFLKVSPLVEQLLDGFDLRVLGRVVSLEHLDSLVQLVEFKSDFVVSVEDTLDVVLDLDKLVDVLKLIFLLLGTLDSVSHVVVPLLKLGVEELLHHLGVQVVVLDVVVVSVEAHGVWGSSDVDELALVVLESGLDSKVALLLHLIGDVVLTVVAVLELGVDGLLSSSLGDSDLEVVSSGLSVLTHVVSGLDDESDWDSDSHTVAETWSVAERFVGSGVHEEGESLPGGSQVRSGQSKLDDSWLWSETLEGWRHTGDGSLVFELSRHNQSLLGWLINWAASLSKEDADSCFFETNTSDGDWDVTGELTEAWVNRGNGVGWSDDFLDVESVEVVEPAVVPSTEDDESGVFVVVGHRGVLSLSWDEWLGLWVRGNGGPLHIGWVHVQEAGGVNVVTEVSGGTLVEVSRLSSEDEVFPGWNGFDHDGAVVPSWDSVEDIWVRPELGLKVEHDGVAVLGLRVPSTIDVNLVGFTEDGVTSSWFWWVVVWLDLLPKVCFSIKAVDVVESNTGVVKTSMSSEDVDFLSHHGSSSVGSWSWDFLSRLLSSDVFSPDLLPLVSLGL